jgi:UrcA family protein
MKIVTILTAALVLGASTTAPASAQTTAVRVSYADLDLKSPAGVKTLNRRLAVALSRVCGDLPTTSIGDTRPVQECRAEAQKGIDAQVAEAMRRYGSEGQTRVASTR